MFSMLKRSQNTSVTLQKSICERRTPVDIPDNSNFISTSGQTPQLLRACVRYKTEWFEPSCAQCEIIRFNPPVNRCGIERGSVVWVQWYVSNLIQLSWDITGTVTFRSYYYLSYDPIKLCVSVRVCIHLFEMTNYLDITMWTIFVARQ